MRAVPAPRRGACPCARSVWRVAPCRVRVRRAWPWRVWGSGLRCGRLGALPWRVPVVCAGVAHDHVGMQTPIYGQQVEDTNMDTIHSGYAPIRTHTHRIRKDTRPIRDTRPYYAPIRGQYAPIRADMRTDSVHSQTAWFASHMFPLKNLGLLIICGVFFIAPSWFTGGH